MAELSKSAVFVELLWISTKMRRDFTRSLYDGIPEKSSKLFTQGKEYTKTLLSHDKWETEESRKKLLDSKFTSL